MSTDSTSPSSLPQSSSFPSPPPSLFDLHPFDPDYFMAAVRNLATMSPGLLAVIMLAAIIYRKIEMYRQYKLTVVFLTFGGFSLAIPILSFNLFMVIVIPLRPQFLISTLTCSFIKQLCAATMNSSFAITCAISVLRYALVMHDVEMRLPQLLILYLIIASPLYVYFILVFFVGTIRKNDECPFFIEIEWDPRPIFYFGYLALIILITDFCNIRVLWFLIQHKRKMSMQLSSVINDQFIRKERDQLHLSIGLLVQSITVTCTFGSTILFMLLFSNLCTCMAIDDNEYSLLYFHSTQPTLFGHIHSCIQKRNAQNDHLFQENNCGHNGRANNGHNYCSKKKTLFFNVIELTITQLPSILSVSMIIPVLFCSVYAIIE